MKLQWQNYNLYGYMKTPPTNRKERDSPQRKNLYSSSWLSAEYYDWPIPSSQ